MSFDYNEAARLIRLGKRSERRGKALQGCLRAILAKVLSDLLTGWTVMLAVGVAHAEWMPALPTIGYWWTVLIVVLTRALFIAAPKTIKE
jgi:hypothetical protein